MATLWYLNQDGKFHSAFLSEALANYQKSSLEERHPDSVWTVTRFCNDPDEN